MDWPRGLRTFFAYWPPTFPSAGLANGSRGFFLKDYKGRHTRVAIVADGVPSRERRREHLRIRAAEVRRAPNRPSALPHDLAEVAPAGEVGHVRVILSVHGLVEEAKLAVVPLVGDGAAGDLGWVAGLLVTSASGLREVLAVAAASDASVVLEDAGLGELGGIAGEGVVVGQRRGGVVRAVHVVVEEDGALVVAAGGGCDGGGGGLGRLLNDWGRGRLYDVGLLGHLDYGGCRGRGSWRWRLNDGLRSRGGGGGWLGRGCWRWGLDDRLGDGWGHDRRGRGGGWDDDGAGLIGV